jgi:Fic family protein
MLFSAPTLNREESEVLQRIEEAHRQLAYSFTQPRRWVGLLRRNMFARAIRGSNSIEGYNVTQEDALAAAEAQAPMDADDSTWPAIVGYRNAMTYVLQLSDDPHFSYQESLIRSLHFMMLHYDLTKHPGQWRPGVIYVRNDETGEIVYEGPDADKVPALIGELVEWLNSVDAHQPAMVRAAMAHLNLVMIHPFSDGNGRMARCLHTLVLARQQILHPTFCSVEEYLGRNTMEYYAVLEEVGQGKWNPSLNAGKWVRFSLKAHYFQAVTLQRRVKEMGKLWDALEQEILKRKLNERMMIALSDAAIGLYVRNSTYRSAAEISDAVAQRDLKALVDEGLLLARGQKRGRVYARSPLLARLQESIREPRKIEDPFQ